MNKKLIHAHTLPREKLKRLGAAQLKDHELIALLLRTGISKKNVLDLSREILDGKQMGGLISLTLSELGRINGLGQSKAASLIAAFEIGKRLYSAASNEEVIINSPSDVSDQLKEIRSKTKEHFVAFLLNARNQLMRKEIISIGTLSASLVHPREVFEPAISHKSAAIIVAHNHPSGDPTPSDADIKITTQLSEAGSILGIEILDHVIVTGKKFLSMKAEGYIK